MKRGKDKGKDLIAAYMAQMVNPDNHFTIWRKLAKILTPTESLFICDLINLPCRRTSILREIDGEIYMMCKIDYLLSVTEWWTESRQEMLFKSLKKKGYVIIRRVGIPAIRHVRVDQIKLWRDANSQFPEITGNQFPEITGNQFPDPSFLKSQGTGSPGLPETIHMNDKRIIEEEHHGEVPPPQAPTGPSSPETSPECVLSRKKEKKVKKEGFGLDAGEPQVTDHQQEIADLCNYFDKLRRSKCPSRAFNKAGNKVWKQQLTKFLEDNPGITVKRLRRVFTDYFDNIKEQYLPKRYTVPDFLDSFPKILDQLERLTDTEYLRVQEEPARDRKNSVTPEVANTPEPPKEDPEFWVPDYYWQEECFQFAEMWDWVASKYGRHEMPKSGKLWSAMLPDVITCHQERREFDMPAWLAERKERRRKGKKTKRGKGDGNPRA